MTIAFQNRSARPLRAVMQHFLDEDDNGHGLANLGAANADNGARGVGAAWDFDVPGDLLAPGARSAVRELLFRFEGGIPDTPQGSLAPGFRVFCKRE